MGRVRKFRAGKAVFTEPSEIVRVWALRAESDVPRASVQCLMGFQHDNTV